jgi:hypothetical protein
MTRGSHAFPSTEPAGERVLKAPAPSLSGDTQKVPHDSVQCELPPTGGRFCPTCGNTLVQRANEKLCRFKEREYCGRYCARHRPSKDVADPKPCANPACKVIMHQGVKEGRKKFEERKTCGKTCSDVLKRGVEYRARIGALVKNGWQMRAIRQFAGPPASKNTGITSVEEFLALRGATKCPPAYAFNSTGQISDADRQFHAERYAEMERQRLANVKRRGVSS